MGGTGTLIFIFLMDNFPDRIYNRSLETVQVTRTKTLIPHKCDNSVTDPLLQLVSRELDMLFIPNWMVDDESPNMEPNYINSNSNSNFYNESSYETMLNINKVLGLFEDGKSNSAEIFEYDLDKSEYDKYHTFTKDKMPDYTSKAAAKSSNNDKDFAASLRYYKTNEHLEPSRKSKTTDESNEHLNHFGNLTSKEKSNSVHGSGVDITDSKENLVDSTESYESIDKVNERLVAIFESVSNVTAQTCGGTLLSPYWVITAASCVNLLGNLFENTTHSNEESLYTIIINATDPLVDGTAHNVTEIHIHPQPYVELDLNHVENDTNDLLRHLGRSIKPDIALMKIEPPVDGKELRIVDVKQGVDVTVFGWAVLKNETVHDTMRATSFEAHTISTSDCSTHYNITEDASELCLSTSADNSVLITQMSWGGPVVTKYGLVGVARADGHSPLAAWPLASHTRWIHEVIIQNI